MLPILREIPFFLERSLPDSDLIEILHGIRLRVDPEKTITVRYGDPGDTFFIIIVGQVDVWEPVPFEKIKKLVNIYIEKLEQESEAPGFCYFDTKHNSIVDFDLYFK